MYLHEEYIKRHNLKIPVVVYCPRSTVLIRHKADPSLWRVLNFNWRTPDKHPGFYEATYDEVRHDGYIDHRFLEPVLENESCFFDEYENSVKEIVGLIRETNFKAIEIEDQLLSLWCIFLIVYDSWLAKNMPKEFFDKVVISIDETKEKSKRLDALKESEQFLYLDKIVNNFWVSRLLPINLEHSDWLIRLIND